MKKLFQSVSPFSLLLVPVFLFSMFTALNTGMEIPAEKYKASVTFRIPALFEVAGLQGLLGSYAD